MDYIKQHHHFPAHIVSYRRENNNAFFLSTDNHGKDFEFEISFYKRNIIRFHLHSFHYKEPYYSIRNEEALNFQDIRMEESVDHITICTDELTLEIGKNPFSLRLMDQEGIIFCEENMRDVNSVGEGCDQVPPIGYSENASGEVIGMNIGLKIHYNEHIYGLGEHFTAFDKIGQTIKMRNFDTLGCRDNTAYKNIPFYVSSYGYGLYVNHPGIFDFHIGTESVSTLSVHVPDTSLEFFIIADHQIKNVISTYMQLTGPAVLPPKWSFGLWYSTGFKDNSRENAEQDAALFRDKGIPCDVMHFDCYWLRSDMWCDFVWNEAQYPNHIEMINQLKKQGYKICLWMNPYVTIISEMYQEGKSKNYFVKNQYGEVYEADLWHGLLPYCVMVDFTNPDAYRWYQEKVKCILGEGVDVLKTDFGEDIPEDSIFFNGLTGKEMRNIYTRLYNQNVFEATKECKGEGNALVWARSGCAGMQSFPVCWSGDPYSSFEGMAATLRSGLSMAMSGVPFWSHDMGGFYGEVTEDIFIRWSQFGLFSSHSRLHGTTTRQPWAYGNRAYEIVKKYIKLRYQLMPYILNTAKQCVEKGQPFIRPLIYEHPEDFTALSIADEYYFGNAILVAPVFGGNNAKRSVYLPQGIWKDMLTGRKYEGNQWYEFICPLEYMPIFKRGDMTIETGEAGKFME